LQEASLSVPGYPLIPSFSPKGEKESEARKAYERAEHYGRAPRRFELGGLEVVFTLGPCC